MAYSSHAPPLCPHRLGRFAHGLQPAHRCMSGRVLDDTPTKGVRPCARDTAYTLERGGARRDAPRRVLFPVSEYPFFGKHKQLDYATRSAEPSRA
jgi:hypothetical protein